MKSHSSRRMTVMTATLALVVAGFGLGGKAAHAATPVPSSTPAPAVTGAPATSPQLSIAISDGHGSARRGDSLTYSIVVVNLGAKDVHALTIAQSIPAGMTFGTATARGRATSSSVSWVTDIGASKKVRLTTTMSVAKTPTNVLRLATVACASQSPKDAPVVCAADSDLLPAGAAAATASGSGAHSQGVGMIWWLVAAAILLVLVLAILAIVLSPRRRARRAVTVIR